jgi:hypothetical protein
MRRLACTLVTAVGLAVAACGGGDDGPASPGPVGADSAILLEDFSARTFLPADNWWNVSVASAPVDPESDTLIHFISARTLANPGANRQMHPDFGPPPYGIPYIGVSDAEPLSPVTYVLYGSQSDVGAPGAAAGFPIPRAARTRANFIEGGVAGGGTSGDRHLIVVDRDRNLLFETWATRWNGRWEAGSGAVFDLASNARRPDGWTSADAAGLAIFPGLVRYDEFARNAPITHAFPRDGARDQRLRLAGVARGRVDRGCAADGRAAPPEGVGGHQRLPGRRAADLPGDEDVRAHRRGQRQRPVRLGHDGPALGQ